MPAEKVLAIDIGGSHIKAMLMTSQGETLQDYNRLPTPVPATPKEVLAVIKQLADTFLGYTKISAGFPGYIKKGIVHTAPNLGTDAWKNIDLAKELSQLLGAPAKVINDADFQGLGLVSGQGLELVVTLGTGFGTAILYDGKLLPHFEIAHHPVTKTKDYDEYIGKKTLDEIGKERWNKRMERVFLILKTVFNYDRLYISGGNARKLNFELDDNMVVLNNRDGIKGAAKLWQQEEGE